jgi:Aspartyl protease
MLHRVFLAAAVAAFASLSLPATTLPAAAADEAAALLAKHAAYVGWHTGDGVVKTLRETGEVTRDGKPRATLTALRYGIAHRDTYVSADGVHSDDGFTGSVAWRSNGNGFTVRAIGEVVRALFDIDALFGETTASGAFTGAVRGTQKVGGADCTIVRLASQVGFPIDVYVDPATGAYRRAVIDPDGKYEESFDGIDYTAVDGKRFISAWHHGSSKTRYSYTKIEPNAALEPDELRPPKQTATWTFGDQPAPIEYVDQPAPRIYVDVVVNGVKGKFILDTGAEDTVIFDSFARRTSAKRFGEQTIGGIGPGTVKANLFRVDTLAVGGSTVHDLIVSSGLDEQMFGREGVVGIIGFDLLAATVADLSLDAKTLRLMDPAKTAPDEHAGIVVHIDLSDGHIRTPMRVDDKVDVIATLDSGNPSDVLVSTDFVKRNRLDFMTKYYAVTGGVGGTEIEHCGKLHSLSLGPVRYPSPATCDSPSFAQNEILVGLDFMRAFNFVFDYSNGIMVMIPRKNY